MTATGTSLTLDGVAMTLDARAEIVRAVREHLSPDLDIQRLAIALLGAAIELLATKATDPAEKAKLEGLLAPQNK